MDNVELKCRIEIDSPTKPRYTSSVNGNNNPAITLSFNLNLNGY